MGLLDVLNGMQNGPRGQPQPSAPGSGGMSKTTMALLAFLAYKAYKGFNNSQPAQAGVPSRCIARLLADRVAELARIGELLVARHLAVGDRPDMHEAGIDRTRSARRGWDVGTSGLAPIARPLPRASGGLVVTA